MEQNFKRVISDSFFNENEYFLFTVNFYRVRKAELVNNAIYV